MTLPAYATLDRTSVEGHRVPDKVLELVERLEASGAKGTTVRSYWRDMSRVWPDSDQTQYVRWVVSTTLPKWWPVSPEARPSDRARMSAEYRWDPGRKKFFSAWSYPAKKAKDGAFYFLCSRCGGRQPTPAVLERMDNPCCANSRMFYWEHAGDRCPNGSTWMNRIKVKR